MPGVRGFSCNPNVQPEAPTLRLDEEPEPEPWRQILEGMDMEQCQRILESLTEEQKDWWEQGNQPYGALNDDFLGLEVKLSAA